MDFLIQRYLPHTANDAHRNSGTWEDVGIARDMNADDDQKAAEQAMQGVPPLPGDQPDELRAIKLDHLSQFHATPNGYRLAPADKGLRGQ